MYAFIFKINVGMYDLMHGGRISDKEIVCRARPKITSQTQNSSYGRTPLIYLPYLAQTFQISFIYAFIGRP